ncbi:MAG: hypothetical protein ABIB47_05155 [Candidatus Woesearchaeota archaeon]
MKNKQIVYLIILLSLASFVSAYTYLGESSIGWVFNTTQEDKNIQVNMAEIEDNILEINITQRTNVPQGYQYHLAICNITGLDGFTYNNDDAPYGRLTDYNLPETWCSETNGYGFPLIINSQILPLSFRISIPDKILKKLPHFMIYSGDSTEIIDVSAASEATKLNMNENIVRDSKGNLYATYLGEGNDLWYSKSSAGAMGWQSKELIEGSFATPGILVDDNNNISIYYTDTSGFKVIKMINSTDGGGNFSSPSTIFADMVGSYEYPSCAIDSNDLIHCCAILDNQYLHYANSTAWSKTTVNGNSTDDTDWCDIELDSNNIVYIAALGTDDYDIDLWTSKNGWGSANRITVDEDVYSIFGGEKDVYPHAPSIAIDDDNNVYIAYSDKGDLTIANSSADHITDFTILGIDSSGSYSPDIAANNLEELHILYHDKTSIKSTIKLYHANSSDKGVSWTYRQELQDKSGYPSIADTNHPRSNRLTNNLRYVFTNTSASVLYDYLSISHIATEGEGREAIEEGFLNTLISGYGNYTDQQVYIRNITNGQQLGLFDKVAVKENQTWAVNYVTSGESFENMVNITPVFYTLEMENLYYHEILEMVEDFIEGTE